MPSECQAVGIAGLLNPGSQMEFGKRTKAAQRLWVSLVGLEGLLVRSLSGRQLAERAVVIFAVTAHERLVLALEPPVAGDSGVPLLKLPAIQAGGSSCCHYLEGGRSLWQWLLLHSFGLQS